MLRGRRQERTRVDGLLAAARAGRSGVLVVRGAPGIGKTALLEYGFEVASGFRVARTTGVEAEMELAFSGLHQLCAPMLDRLERLPSPQSDALGTALGLISRPAPDRFLVSLAVLGLLSEVADEQPLLCLADDAQWLDPASAQVLSFVARHLQAVPLAVLFAVCEPSEARAFSGLPELVLEGLPADDARELLGSVMPGLEVRVRDWLIDETQGNPLALLELPRASTPAELAAGFGMPGTLPLPGRIERSFRQRVERLPPQTQRLLLVAAAEPAGDQALLWRAAALLGIGVEAATRAEADGLLHLGARVHFLHPLARSAVYRGASFEDRRGVHHVLAEATDPAVDPDHRAWHRAEAALGPDEDVADELERSAERAQARGGRAPAAALLERAVALTPTPARRARRALAAAQAKHDAGAPDAALGLLATAETAPLDELQRAQLERLHGQIELHLGHGGGAPSLLLAAARRLERFDVQLARETYLEGLWAAIVAGRLGSKGAVAEVAGAARAAPPTQEPPRAVDLLLDGLATLYTDGYAAAVPSLKRAVGAFRGEDVPGEDDRRWLCLACRIAMDLWDDESWPALVSRQVQLARDAGALTVLPIALSQLPGVHPAAGDFAAVAALIDEAPAVTATTGYAPILYAPVMLAAWRGWEAETDDLFEILVREATAREEGLSITLAQFARAQLYNGLGRYGDALAAAQRASQDDAPGFSVWALPELVEAAARARESALADSALGRLRERTSLSGTEWALGIEARSRALVSEDKVAEELYRESIERLGRCPVVLHLARAHLVYGEWLRRERRRLEAREQLRTAHEMLAAMGADGFAERAARELLATGEKVRKRTVETTRQLTAQEAEVARLARRGRSNPEIGAQLFISRRTVEYHLHKVFTKLDISSRSQLDRVLNRDSGPCRQPAEK